MGFLIDNVYHHEINAPHGTIFQKCADRNIDLPCFCYHESLSIAGNCRMCLVEASNSLKLVVSCAMPMAEEIKVYTNNNRVKKARESVLEFLLINHPLDCPICDQGGECDLQDITLVFGSDKSRFYEYSKRAIFDRNCGPLIKMLMTRCIHCTRCVRFLNEIAGTNDFGMLGRGESSEIGTYIKHYLIDELSGNIIDLCPVGALTSKPYSFKVRPWELSSLESIDVLDSMASNIRIDFFNNKVYRILPIYDKNVNEDWITNRARFVYDSNIYQRINYPLFKLDNKFVSISWRRLIYIYFFYMNEYMSKGIISLFGSFNDLYLVNNMSNFFNLLGTEVNIMKNHNINSDFRQQYHVDQLMNIFENSINILFVGMNIRLELPLLNSKLRKYMYNYGKKIKIFYIGLSNSYHNIPIISCGNSISDFLNIICGKNHLNLNVFFKKGLQSMFFHSLARILSIKILINNNIPQILKLYVADFLNKYLITEVNYIVDDISLLSIYENNNFRSDIYNYKIKGKFVFLENFDDQLLLSWLNKNDFIVYHGQFIGFSANIANLLIPSLSIYEYNGTFINLEGRIRRLTKVVSQNSISSSDFFTILKLCYSNYIKTNLYFIKNFNKIISYFDFLIIDWNIDRKYYSKGLLSNSLNIKYNTKINYMVDKKSIFNSTIINYYKSDIYSMNSKNMHLASLDYLVRLKMFI